MRECRSYDQDMALIYNTVLNPSKLELLGAWLPTQLWFEGDISALDHIGSYRFDDPDGEVGMEGFLVTAGDDAVYHVPLSYRAAPLEGAEAHLIGTSEHGVLGTRYFYNAMGDPVYRHVLAATIAHGGTEAAEEVVQSDGATVPREIFTRLRGSGSADQAVPGFVNARVTDEDGITYAVSGTATLAVKRIATREGHGPDGAFVLEATWPHQDTPTVIAVLHQEDTEEIE